MNWSQVNVHIVYTSKFDISLHNVLIFNFSMWTCREQKCNFYHDTTWLIVVTYTAVLSCVLPSRIVFESGGQDGDQFSTWQGLCVSSFTSHDVFVWILIFELMWVRVYLWNSVQFICFQYLQLRFINSNMTSKCSPSPANSDYAFGEGKCFSQQRPRPGWDGGVGAQKRGTFGSREKIETRVKHEIYNDISKVREDICGHIHAKI